MNCDQRLSSSSASLSVPYSFALVAEKRNNNLAVAELSLFLTGLQIGVPCAKSQQRYLQIFTNRIAGTALNCRIGMAVKTVPRLRKESKKYYYRQNIFFWF